jgi:pentatricopeptide repeat protein
MKRWRDQEIMHTYNSEMAVLAARPALSAVAAASGGGQGGAAVAAVRLLQEMADNGIPRDQDSFNMALEACARGGDVAAARRVFEALDAHPQARPDVFSYVTLACALARDGRGKDAMAVLDRMVSLGGKSGGGLRKKTRWPAYYRELWPQTAKALGKTILTLAAEDGGRCAGIGRLLQFLTTHMPIINAQAVAELLVGKGLCTTEHITTLTGGSLATKWAAEGSGGQGAFAASVLQ